MYENGKNVQFSKATIPYHELPDLRRVPVCGNPIIVYTERARRTPIGVCRSLRGVEIFSSAHSAEKINSISVHRKVPYSKKAGLLYDLFVVARGCSKETAYVHAGTFQRRRKGSGFSSRPKLNSFLGQSYPGSVAPQEARLGSPSVVKPWRRRVPVKSRTRRVGARERERERARRYEKREREESSETRGA